MVEEVICILSGENITLGKKYMITNIDWSYIIDSDIDYEYFKIVNDSGEKKWYSSDHFSTIDKNRDKKINSLLE